MFEFTGIDPTYKVPRYLAKIVFSAGAISAGAAPLFVLYVGPKTAAGSIVADNDVLEVASEDEVDAKAGPRSLLAWMARAGVKAAPTCRHFIAAVTEAGAAATASIVIGGTWTTSGEWALEMGGMRVVGQVASTSTVDQVGADMEAKVNGAARFPVTAGTYNTATDTLILSCANTGAVGKDWILRVDKSKLPVGMTITVTGSEALGGDRVRLGLAGGTGTESITTLLTKLQTTRYARIVAAQNDSVNAQKWEDHVNDLSGATKLILEQLVFGHSGTTTAAGSFGTTTLNAQRAQIMYMRNADIHPAVVAAVKGAIRAQTEGGDPVPDYDGLILPGIPPNIYDGDNLTDSEVNVLLNSGVTPVVSSDGRAKVVRSITSYCRLDATTPDERTLDIGDAVMTDYATVDLRFLYQTQFRVANKYVQDDPLPGEPEPPPGVGYPRLWNNSVYNRLEFYWSRNWAEHPSKAMPVSQFNNTVKAIESNIPLVVRRVQHQMRNIVRQTVL